MHYCEPQVTADARVLRTACTLSQAPRRMVCTGYGNGGAEAELCGIWAAVTYPAAQIRTIAFGAPVVSVTCNMCLASQQRPCCSGLEPGRRATTIVVKPVDALGYAARWCMRQHVSPPPAGPASAARCFTWVDERPPLLAPAGGQPGVRLCLPAAAGPVVPVEHLHPPERDQRHAGERRGPRRRSARAQRHPHRGERDTICAEFGCSYRVNFPRWCGVLLPCGVEVVPQQVSKSGIRLSCSNIDLWWRGLTSSSNGSWHDECRRMRAWRPTAGSSMCPPSSSTTMSPPAARSCPTPQPRQVRTQAAQPKA